MSASPPQAAPTRLRRTGALTPQGLDEAMIRRVVDHFYARAREDDLIGAAEGVFGRGAKGLALLIQDILKKQGRA